MELWLLVDQESDRKYSSVETPVWFYQFLSLEYVEILIKNVSLVNTKWLFNFFFAFYHFSSLQMFRNIEVMHHVFCTKLQPVLKY